MKFIGLGDGYRGEIGLHLTERKIVFLGNDKPFHVYFESTYLEIIIKNQKGEVIKDIVINGTNSMFNVITHYELNKGIDYEYGYVIEMKMLEASRTYFIMNENNNYTNYPNEASTTIKTFKIINDKLLSYDFYEQKYLRLLLEWKNNFKQWDEEMRRQIKDYVPKLNEEEKLVWKCNNNNQLLDKLHSLHQDIQIIANGEEIQELRIKVTRLQKDLDDKLSDLYRMINNIKGPISGHSGSISCARMFALVTPIFSVIPGAGTIAAAITGVISAGCAIAEI